jgi:GT2 family glycosyltransferase/lipopolysaccharide/colanic/teichoic acid biosynthesis glycosyltransferase
MDLSIVVITYNSRGPVERLLESLAAHAPSCAFETIVIDNASDDGTADTVARRFPGVRVVANGENLGYSRGVNQGMRLSSGRMLLILNPDIIVQDGSIDRLMTFMERTPDAGIVGSKLLFPDGTLQYSCRSFYTVRALLLRRTVLGKLFPRARALRDHLLLDYDHEQPRAVDWILGACMLVRREAIEKVGAMDERFFLYFEDLDWCYRMKHYGWSVYYVPSSVMIHTYERSSARSVLRKPFLIHLLSLFRYYEKWNRFFYLMRRNRGAIKSTVLVACDLVAFNAGYVAAYYLRMVLQPLFVHHLYPMSWYGFFIFFYNLVFLMTFLAGGLYRVRRETPAMEEFMRILRSALLGLVILIAATYISRVKIYSRAVVIGQAGLAVLIAFALRQAVRAVHRQLVRARFDLKRVLLVGTREEALAVSERISGAWGLGIDVVGYLDDGADSLGTPAQLPEIIDRLKIQEVIVCESRQCDASLLPFFAFSRGRLIQVRILSPLARFVGSGVRVEEIAGLPVFSMERRSVFRFERALKRLADFFVGLALLPFVSVASLVRRMYGRSGGRARFFSERRAGAGGAPFSWPRVVAADGREGGDFGKPGLWLSLVRGSLSLVGPPPLYEAHASEYASAFVGVRPGITGRWRFSKHAAARSALEEEALGLESWSIGQDVTILARTLGLMRSGRYPAWFYRKGDSA